jgi:hypothetical protein
LQHLCREADQEFEDHNEVWLMLISE